MAKSFPASKVGNVVFVELHKEPSRTYSDGDIENRLLDLFKASNPDVPKFMEEHSDWATTYHLTPVRENLLNWFDFDPEASLLEVGAGCGALTGLFAEKCDSVTALELSNRRAKINAYRHKDRDNLKVVVGNLEHLDKYDKQQFDYVVCVGVLEYAGMFIGGETPFKTFLESLRKHTKKGGTLILAIENRLGLKYLSGAKEDHVRRYFESVEGYPHYGGIRTFGKQELAELLSGSGFPSAYFYFPLPDYKMPHKVYSESFLPGKDTPNVPVNAYPTPTPDQPRQQIMREQLAVQALANNGIFGEFANSFLVIASDKKVSPSVVFAQGSANRKAGYRISTRLKKDKDGLRAEKAALTVSGMPHINSLAQKESQLNKFLKNGSLEPVAANTRDNYVDFDFVEGPTFESRLVELLAANELDTFNEQMSGFVKIIDGLPSTNCVPSDEAEFVSVFGKSYKKHASCLKLGLVDLNFDNLIAREPEKYVLIDYEWVFAFPVPKNYVISRSLMYFFARYNQIVRAITSPANPAIELGKTLIIPKKIHDKWRTYFDGLREVILAEKGFQKYVGSTGSAIVLYDSPKTISHECVDNLPDIYEAMLENYSSAEQQLQQKDATIRHLEAQLNEIVSSKSWKVLTKVNSTRSKFKK